MNKLAMFVPLSFHLNFMHEDFEKKEENFFLPFILASVHAR